MRFLDSFTLGGVAEEGLEIAEPLDLGHERAGVPDDVAEPLGHEVGRVERGGAGDGEVGALPEVLPLRLRRRRQRQPEVLGCRSGERFPSDQKKKGRNFTSFTLATEQCIKVTNS